MKKPLLNILRKPSHLLGWFNKSHPAWDTAIWIDKRSNWHRLSVLDCRSTCESKPDPTCELVANKWAKADTAFGMEILRALRDGTERAVQTGHSLARPRHSRDYSKQQGFRMGRWGVGQEEGVERNIANAARLMTGEYPTSRIEVMRALAQAREAGPYYDETGCIFKR